MAGQSGVFTIKLAVHCTLIVFGIEYKIDLQLQMKDAVKQFEILGVYEENKEFNSVSLGLYQFGLVSENEKTKLQEMYPYACASQLLTQTNNMIKQYFICYEEDCNKSFDIIHVEIYNNQGGYEFTSIYRFAIYSNQITQFDLVNK